MNRITKRKIAVFLFGMVLAASLAACSGAPNTKSSGAAASAESSASGTVSAPSSANSARSSQTASSPAEQTAEQSSSSFAAPQAQGAKAAEVQIASSAQNRAGGSSTPAKKPASPAKQKSAAPASSAGKAVPVAPVNTSLANQVLQLVNQERSKNGLAALTMNAGASQAAQVRATEIVGTFSHTRPDGTSCFTALNQAKVSYSTAGENIAYGYPDAASVMNGWMNSAGHRANILNASFKQIGVGVYKAPNGNYYWTQEFIG